MFLNYTIAYVFFCTYTELSFGSPQVSIGKTTSSLPVKIKKVELKKECGSIEL